ncbi:hypothetical protein Tco_1537451, partial [Tanacetum coccineum]
MWQPQITNGRKHFHHGNNMKAAKSKISKKEVPGTNKGRKGSMIGFPYSQKPPKEIFALDKGKFKAPPPITTLVEKRNHAKLCEEMLKAGKLSHFIKELKQNNGKEQPKVVKKGETFRKDKALAILMVQPWERVARQRITQSFSPNPDIFFPPLGEDEGTEGPMIIEVEIGGHCVHRMYVDGGSALEI